MLNLENTLNKIREGGYEAVILYHYSARNTKLRFSKHTVEEGGTVEDLISDLMVDVARFGSDAKFEIEAKAKDKANTGNADVWQFSNDGADKYSAQRPAVPGSGAGQGLGSLGDGYQPMWQRLEDRREQLDRLQRELDKQDLRLEFDRERFREEKARFESVVSDSRKEIQGLQNKYTSNVEMAREAIDQSLGELMKVLAKKGPGVLGALAGGGSDGGGNPDENTPEYMAVAEIAGAIYAHGLDVSQLKRLQVSIEHFITTKIKTSKDEHQDTAGAD